MIAAARDIAAVLRASVQELATAGWDALQGVRLGRLAAAILEAGREHDWREACRRAEAIGLAIDRFGEESPEGDPLASVLSTTCALADLLEGEALADALDAGLLPAEPAAWTFLVVGDGPASDSSLLAAVRCVGFRVEIATGPAEVMRWMRIGRTVVLASTRWLVAHAEQIDPARPAEAGIPLASALLVAVVDADDFGAQRLARKAGACLLLDAPVALPRLVAELAGLAWMPRVPYRVLLLEGGTQGGHDSVLRTAGFDVLTCHGVGEAWEKAGEFAPEVCILGTTFPAEEGADLIALLRRDARRAGLSGVFLADGEGDADLLLAEPGGTGDHGIADRAARRLVMSAMAAARQFRLLHALERLRQGARKQLGDLEGALDAHAAVSLAARDGVILAVNQRFCDVSGYGRDELIGSSYQIVKSGHHPPAFFADMWTTIEQGRIWRGEIKSRGKDGGAYWEQCTIVPLLDDSGSPERYLSLRTETTEHKRALAEREREVRLLDLLRRALQHFMATQDVAATSVLLLEGMLILTESAFGFLGEVVHDADGAPFLKTHAITDIAWDEESRRLLEAGNPTRMEFRGLHNLFGRVLRSGEAVIANEPASDMRRGGLPPGHPSLSAFLGMPIHHGGALVGMIGLANRPGGYDASTLAFIQPLAATYADILEAARLRHFQQHAIDELEQARSAAERLSRAKDESLAAWGHELRTPLSAILGYAQSLQTRCGHDVENRYLAQQIVRAGEDLGKLIAGIGVAGREHRAGEGVPAPGLRVEAECRGVRRRILVAEDNPANQAVLRMQLDVLGFDPIIAGDGSTALAAWKAGGHDLILADRNMPGMDGLALARSIRAAEREGGVRVPIIAITAARHAEDIAACVDAGMDEVLAKPIELDDLRQLLDRWLPRPALSAADAPLPLARLAEPGPSIDTAYVARVVGRMTTAQLRELIDLFTATTRADLPACTRMIGERDGRALGLAMHKLKSSARIVGALRCAALAERIEEVAGEGRLAVASDLLAELDHAVGDVESAVQRLTAAPSLPGPGEATPASLESGPRRVLVLDDDPVPLRQTVMLLESLGIREIRAVDSGEAALEDLRRPGSNVDFLVTDLNMPGMDGIEFLRQLAASGYQGCLVIASGLDDQLLDTAAEVVRAKGLRLRGTVRKPMTLDALASLLSVVCDSAAPPAAQVRAEIAPNDILDAIDRDEFSVHFQPKADARTMRVVGVEALAYWQRHGRRIRTEDFIAAAEQNGLIGPLSEVLLTKAMVGGARLADAGFPLSVAVNLSANWLGDIHLPEFILASLQATGLKAEDLILEITETGVMADLATSLDVLTRLRLKGFKLSIDDFGTGYSSMEQLQRIPFGELKLDRGFLRRASERPSAHAILASSIEMARKLKLTTVAEGVETQADLDLVRGLGCDLIQGWFLAKPMPVDVLIAWLGTRVQ